MFTHPPPSHSPVPLMGLVEVVKLPTTDPAVLAAAVAFVKACKKTPVVCGDTPGFVVNRLLVPYLAQAIALADAGVASHRDIDIAMQLGTGVPMVRVWVGFWEGGQWICGGQSFVMLTVLIYILTNLCPQ